MSNRVGDKPLGATPPEFIMAIEYVAHAALTPDPHNNRKHPKAQLVKLEASIREFGLNAPILIDEDNNIIAGHARLVIAEMLRMDFVPCVRLRGLTLAQKRATFDCR